MEGRDVEDTKLQTCGVNKSRGLVYHVRTVVNNSQLDSVYLIF